MSERYFAVNGVHGYEAICVTYNLLDQCGIENRSPDHQMRCCENEAGDVKSSVSRFAVQLGDPKSLRWNIFHPYHYNPNIYTESTAWTNALKMGNANRTLATIYLFAQYLQHILCCCQGGSKRSRHLSK